FVEGDGIDSGRLMRAREVVVLCRLLQLNALVDGRKGELGGVDAAALKRNKDFAAWNHLRTDPYLGQGTPGQPAYSHLQTLEVCNSFNFLVEPASRLGRHDHARKKLDVVRVVSFLDDLHTTTFPDPFRQYFWRGPKRQGPY